MTAFITSALHALHGEKLFFVSFVVKALLRVLRGEELFVATQD
jgi:hypothetical protein